MEIKKENLVNAYMAGNDSVKDLLRTIFPDMEFEADIQAEKRPITERIKTFEDACQELGEEHPFVVVYRTVEEIDECSGDIEAYLKLRIIVTALNEGWEPKFTEDKLRWYPWFVLWTSEEVAEKDEKWKRDRHLINVGDYKTEYAYAGFACAYSHDTPSIANMNVGYRLCLKSEALTEYCGKQFINLWIDFNLIRS